MRTHFGSSAMNLFAETEDSTKDRKFIKSQVEKRRRERMNRSLERLRTMLLQEPQQPSGTQRRVEKAEILEHTVLFLQSTAKQGDGTGTGTRAGAGSAGGGQKHPFQDGFSTCLQRAAQFLGPQGRGLWLGAALDACFSARVQRRPEARSPSGSLTQTRSVLRMLRQKSKHGLHARAFGANGSAHPYRRPVRKGSPRPPRQPQRQNPLEIRVASRASKQNQSCPVSQTSQTLWRPWP